MNVAALFTDRIKLIEEQDARSSPCILEQSGEASVRLAEISADQCIVTDGEQRHGNGFGNRLGERGLPVAWRTRKQNTVARLHTLGAEQIGAPLFFDKLPRKCFRGQRQNQAFESCARL